MWNKYTLPTSISINNEEHKISYKYSDILEIFNVLSDKDLIESERILVALYMFYPDIDIASLSTDTTNYIIDAMMQFIGMSTQENSSATKNRPPEVLFDWSQDFNIIISPINKILGYDVRTNQNLHWWTFLSAFYEIGECTFSTYVSIRNKLNHNVKLEKWEEKIYKENLDSIRLIKKYDSETQALLDSILG